MAESWLGGDTATLRALVDELRPGKSRADTVVGYIDQDVRKVSQDEGWTGDAATAFAAHWSIAAVATSAVGAFANAAAEVLGTLATNLDRIETALRQAAAEARAEGAPIGADGRPPTGPLTAPEKDPSDAYVQVWNLAQQEAQGYRVDADRDMLDVLHQVMRIVDGAADGEGLANADKVALADYLRGIGAIPSSARTVLDGRTRKADDAYQEARKAWLAARKATPFGEAMPSDVKLARSGALRDLQALKSQLDALDHQSHPIAKFLDVDVGDVVGAIPRVGAAFAEAADGSKSLSFLSDVPVIDVAAAGLATYFQATDDISKGESRPRAIAEDATANVVGVVAGAAVGTVIAGVAGPEILVGGAAVAVGGAVAVGVGDLVYEGFHEHWDEDIQRDGVVGGIAAGTGHMLRNTGKDMAHLATGAGHAVASVWHGIFG